jgi:hypothetical protein
MEIKKLKTGKANVVASKVLGAVNRLGKKQHGP